MSSSGFPEEHRHSTGVARLIPGTHPFSRGLKQRSHSVNLNLRSWSTATVDGVLHPNPRSDFRRVAEAVPPEPHIIAWRFPVWKSISTDCMLLSMSFNVSSQARFGVRRFFGLTVEAPNSVALPFSQEISASFWFMEHSSLCWATRKGCTRRNVTSLYVNKWWESERVWVGRPF